MLMTSRTMFDLQPCKNRYRSSMADKNEAAEELVPGSIQVKGKLRIPSTVTKVYFLSDGQEDFHRLPNQAIWEQHLLGEGLGGLSVKELEQLERKVESALSRVRERKTQVLLDQIEELQEKLKTVGCSTKANRNSGESNPVVGSNGLPMHPQPNTRDRQPLTQMGSHHFVPDGINPRSTGNENNFMHGWFR